MQEMSQTGDDSIIVARRPAVQILDVPVLQALLRI